MSFCPEGRLRQVEFSMEAIGESNANIGIIYREGIVIATEKKEPKKVLEGKFHTERTFIIDNHIICSASGSIPDSQILINHARIQAQHYKKIYQEFIPVRKIVEIICDVKQQFTHRGSQRPFGVSLLIAGWDSYDGLQLFRTDSSGTFSGWKSVAIGSNSMISQSILTDEYKNDLDLSSAISILIKIFHKKANNEELWKIIDLVYIVLDHQQQVLIRRMSREEINSLVS